MYVGWGLSRRVTHRRVSTSIVVSTSKVCIGAGTHNTVDVYIIYNIQCTCICIHTL